MAADTKSSIAKVKPSSQQPGGGSSSKPKLDSSLAKKKTVESSSKKPISDPKVKSITTPPPVTKTEVKVKVTSTSSKSTTKTTTLVKTKEKREKKVYSLSGQKFDVPEEREPLRIFYESLSEQIPSSEMAEFWLMEHGLLSPERAKKVYAKKQTKQKQIRTGTPTKTPQASKPESSRKPKQVSNNNTDSKSKKKITKYSDDDDEDDFVLSKRRKV
ncbi:protein pxr1 [Impatiens glandulifera]|uniref:protein pxr1 n=1 Tax=Impatiens glandulifera TaxID=253017 RepID=UPI001FB14DA4|nr:protein pxr1 [Impatiens glandulifera]